MPPSPQASFLFLPSEHSQISADPRLKKDAAIHPIKTLKDTADTRTIDTKAIRTIQVLQDTNRAPGGSVVHGPFLLSARVVSSVRSALVSAEST